PVARVRHRGDPAGTGTRGSRRDGRQPHGPAPEGRGSHDLTADERRRAPVRGPWRGAGHHPAGTRRPVRVYLPGTARSLQALLGWGGGRPPVTAFAVTPALREWYVDNDGTELEYAAMLEAARGSLRLLDEDPSAPRRRVVVAADVPDPAV